MARNPFHDPTAASERQAALDFLRRLLTSHLRARPAEAEIPDAELRALHPFLAIQRVWDRIRGEMGL